MRSYGYQPFGSEILSGFGARTPATGYVANADDFGPKLYCGFPNQSFTQNYVYDPLERITQASGTFGTIGSSTPGMVADLQLRLLRQPLDLSRQQHDKYRFAGHHVGHPAGAELVYLPGHQSSRQQLGH